MSAQLVEGDTGSVLRLQCKDDQGGAVIDLTGKTIHLYWAPEGGGALVDRAMGIDGDPTLGFVKYRFDTAEIYSPQMVFDVKIFDADGHVVSVLHLIKLPVRTPL